MKKPVRRFLKEHQIWELEPVDWVFQNKLVVSKQRKVGKVNKQTNYQNSSEVVKTRNSGTKNKITKHYLSKQSSQSNSADSN